MLLLGKERESESSSKKLHYIVIDRETIYSLKKILPLNSAVDTAEEQQWDRAAAAAEGREGGSKRWSKSRA